MSSLPRDKFSAPDSFLGQTYQIWYALLLLLRAGFDDANAAVSVELVDDVAVHSAGVVTGAVQTKRTTTDLSDASVPLWKTLRIWSEHVENDVIDLDHAVLSLVSTSTAPPGSAASMLRPTNRDETPALKLLEGAAARSHNEKLKPAFNAFMALNPAQRAALIRQIRILDGSAGISGIRAEAVKHLRVMAPPGKESAFSESLGQRWKGLVESAIESGTLISHADLRFSISDLLTQFQADNLRVEFRTSLPGVLPPSHDDARRFVRQLRLIQVSEKRLDDARVDYLKAFEQRSNWLRRKLIGLDELPRHEQVLKDECGRRLNAIKESLPTPCQPAGQVAAGRQHYDWAEFQAVNMEALRIRPNCAEPYVVRGTFHLLADREHGGIGWHPEYESLLAEKEAGRPA